MSHPTRRREDISIIRYGYELVAGQVVRRYIRTMSLGVVLAFAFMGYGPLFTNHTRAYQNPVFDGVFTLALPQVWGAAFWTIGALMLIAAMTGRALLYVVALVLATAIMFGWCFGIVFQAWISEDAVLTSGALGLYVFSFSAIIGLAATPDPMELEPEIYERDASGEVVPLRPVERRQTG